MSKKTNHLAVCLFLLLAAAQISFFGQTPQKNENPSWMRVESENKEVSFAIPKNHTFVYDREGFFQVNPRNITETVDFKQVRSLTAHENGATLFFESYRVPNAKKVVSYFLANHRDVRVANLAFGNFSGIEITSEKGVYSALYYLASDENVYLIGVGARRRDNPTLARFLNSVKLGNKTAFNLAGVKAAEPDKTVSILDLPETTFEVETLSDEEKEEDKRKSKEAKSKRGKADADAQGLVVFFKPPAQFTEDARQRREQGKLVLRAAFGADGRIGEIKIVEGLRYGLNEQAVRALRRTRFIPAERNGAPFSVTKPIEYGFTVY